MSPTEQCPVCGATYTATRPEWIRHRATKAHQDAVAQQARRTGPSRPRRRVKKDQR